MPSNSFDLPPDLTTIKNIGWYSTENSGIDIACGYCNTYEIVEAVYAFPIPSPFLCSSCKMHFKAVCDKCGDATNQHLPWYQPICSLCSAVKEKEEVVFEAKSMMAHDLLGDTCFLQLQKRAFQTVVYHPPPKHSGLSRRLLMPFNSPFLCHLAQIVARDIPEEDLADYLDGRRDFSHDAADEMRSRAHTTFMNEVIEFIMMTAIKRAYPREMREAILRLEPEYIRFCEVITSRRGYEVGRRISIDKHRVYVPPFPVEAMLDLRGQVSEMAKPKYIWRILEEPRRYEWRSVP